jgi:hypothetical protein
MDRRVDVEGNKVAATDVLGIVLGMIGPHATTIPAVPGHALTKIEHHRPGRVFLLDLAIGFDDLLRRDRRAVALPLAQRLGVVRLVPVHPADDSLLIKVLQGVLVLVADDRHVVPLQLGDLLGGRPLPQGDVHIDAEGLILGGVAGILQPDGDGEERRVLARSVLPLGIAAHRGRTVLVRGRFTRGARQPEEHPDGSGKTGCGRQAVSEQASARLHGRV